MNRAEELFNDIKARGLQALDDLIDNFTSESFFLDFKASHENGLSQRSLHDNDLKNLSKVISGFGNSEGGVVIWGVDCRRDPITGRDIPQDKKPLIDAIRFKTQIDSSISGRTIPSHQTTESFAILDPNEGSKGYVVTLIPKSSLSPHQSLVDQKFYMRAGSEFISIPYSVLAGMFGKNPNPEVDLCINQLSLQRQTSRVYMEIHFGIKNVSSVIAKHLYLNISNIIKPSPEFEFDFIYKSERHDIYSKIGVQISSVLKTEHTLPPEAITIPFYMRLFIPVNITHDFAFDITFGCDGMIPKRQSILVPKEKINNFIEEFRNDIQDSSSHTFERMEFDMHAAFNYTQLTRIHD